MGGHDNAVCVLLDCDQTEGISKNLSLNGKIAWYRSRVNNAVMEFSSRGAFFLVPLLILGWLASL